MSVTDRIIAKYEGVSTTSNVGKDPRKFEEWFGYNDLDAPKNISPGTYAVIGDKKTWYLTIDSATNIDTLLDSVKENENHIPGEVLICKSNPNSARKFYLNEQIFQGNLN